MTVASQLRQIFLTSWLNVLLVAVPAGIALNYVPSVSRVVIFTLNFLAIIPLVAMLSTATEEISLRTGNFLSGLLNATFGNAVELIVAIAALLHDKYTVVHTSLVGSILSNLLFVLGCCYLFANRDHSKQCFNRRMAQTSASMLVLAAAATIVPTALEYANNSHAKDIKAQLSRGISILLLPVYVAYLLFQYKTERAELDEESRIGTVRGSSYGIVGYGTIEQDLATASHDEPGQNENSQSDDDPKLHFLAALALLICSTIVISLCAEFMIGSMDAVTKSGRLPEAFIGLILLPIVGNAAEHISAVIFAIDGKMDLAVNVAVGSSVQVALFIIPLMVILGWAMDKEVNLSFGEFPVAILSVSALLASNLFIGGRGHWLGGLVLMCLYGIVAVCSFSKSFTLFGTLYCMAGD